jgi:hypothetical protein
VPHCLGMNVHGRPSNTGPYLVGGRLNVHASDSRSYGSGSEPDCPRCPVNHQLPIVAVVFCGYGRSAAQVPSLFFATPSPMGAGCHCGSRVGFRGLKVVERLGLASDRNLGSTDLRFYFQSFQACLLSTTVNRDQVLFSGAQCDRLALANSSGREGSFGVRASQSPCAGSSHACA